MTAVQELPAAPVLIGGEELTVPTAPVINPARVSEVVGEYALGTRHHVDRAVAAAVDTVVVKPPGSWSSTIRARCPVPITGTPC
jgi:delta 1-pyrroline-5-carboxylate dehydrogenase